MSALDQLAQPQPAEKPWPWAVRFTCYGKPEPAGSKQSYVPLDKAGNPFRRPGGGIVVQTVDANRHAKEWKRLVSVAAKSAYHGPPLDGPLLVALLFVLERPQGHLGTGRNAGIVKASAPEFHVVKPDVLKLARAVEDAMTGIVYVDDSQIVQESLTKEYGEQQRVEVCVSPLPLRECDPRDLTEAESQGRLFGGRKS